MAASAYRANPCSSRPRNGTRSSESRRWCRCRGRAVRPAASSSVIAGESESAKTQAAAKREGGSGGVFLVEGGGWSVILRDAVAVQSEFLKQLRRDLGGVLALGITRAPQELSAPAGADDHRLAALVAVDVGRNVGELLAVARGGGVLAEDLGDHRGVLCGAFLKQRDQFLDLRQVRPFQLLHHLRVAALGEAGATEEW